MTAQRGSARRRASDSAAGRQAEAAALSEAARAASDTGIACGCPWAWSASPPLAVLQWRYGDQLRWRHVMIGLTERGSEYERRGYTGEGMARNYRSFRLRGMPFTVTPRERVHGTWPMCRAIVAARLTEPDREWAVFRALQVAQFTTTTALETTEGLASALNRVPASTYRACWPPRRRRRPRRRSRTIETRRGRRARGRRTSRVRPPPPHRRTDPVHGSEPGLHGRRQPQAGGGRLPARRGV